MLALEKELKRRGVSHLHVCAYDSPNSASVLHTLSFNLNDRYEFYIDLAMRLDIIWKSFKASRRNNIRKAENLRLGAFLEAFMCGLKRVAVH